VIHKVIVLTNAAFKDHDGGDVNHY